MFIVDVYFKESKKWILKKSNWIQRSRDLIPVLMDSVL